MNPVHANHFHPNSLDIFRPQMNPQKNPEPANHLRLIRSIYFARKRTRKRARILQITSRLIRSIYFARYIALDIFRPIYLARYISPDIFRSIYFARYISLDIFRPIYFARYISFDVFPHRFPSQKNPDGGDPTSVRLRIGFDRGEIKLSWSPGVYVV